MTIYGELNVVVSEKDYEGKLANLFDFDADFMGDNGEEYLWKEAEGYDSNLEYLMEDGKKKFSSDYIKVIEYVLGRFSSHPSTFSYYEDVEWGVQKINDELAIFSLVAITED